MEQCSVAVIRHGWAIQCFVHVWEALLVRMNRPDMNLQMSISAKVGLNFILIVTNTNI